MSPDILYETVISCSGDMSPDISFYMVISYSGDMSPDILLYTSFSYSGDLSPEFLFKTAISYSGDSDILSPEFLFKTAISYSGDILSPEYPSPWEIFHNTGTFTQVKTDHWPVTSPSHDTNLVKYQKYGKGYTKINFSLHTD